jgi:hypothetical protein
MIQSISFAIFHFWSFVEFVGRADGYDDIKNHPTHIAISAALAANPDIPITIPVEHIIPNKFLWMIQKTDILPEVITYNGKVFVFTNLNDMFYGLVELYEKITSLSPELSVQLAENYYMLKICLNRMENIINQSDLMDVLADMSI